MGAQIQSRKELKVHFSMQKGVEFGKAVYVVGNVGELGCWRVEQGLKLSWN